MYGGQERYIEELSKQLRIKNNVVNTFGGPERLLNNSDKKIHKTNNEIILLNGNAALYKNPFKRTKNSLYIYVQHSDIDDAQQAMWKQLIRKLLIKILLLRVDLVVRVCNKALPDFYAPNKIITIYNGVELPNIDSNNTPSIRTKIQLLMVGAINKNKNQKLAIEALVFLPNAELTILGDGEYIDDMKKLAVDLGVETQINWLGFIKDPTPYYQKADILLMLSHFEAFPYVVLEAMAHKTPVIATRVGGVPEIINNTVNGWLLDNDSPNTLASTITMIENDSDSYCEVANNARKTIEQNFTVEHMTQNLLNAIKVKMDKHAQNSN